MVKAIKILTIVSLAVIVASCTNTEEKQIVNGGPVFRASFDDESSRVILDSRGKYKWNADDRISIYGTTTGNEYAFKGETGDNCGSFAIVDGPAETATFSHYYGVFPHSSSTVCTSEGNFTIEFPSVQSCIGNHIDANLMVAVTESLSDFNLKFRNAGSYLQFPVYSKKGRKLRSITITGNNDEVIAGSATLTASIDSNPVLSMTGNGKTIVLECGDAEVGISSEEATSFRVVLPPVTFSNGFKVVYETDDGNTFERTTSKCVALERNSVQPMGVVNLVTTYKELNGTPIQAGNNLIGIISNASTGEFLEGIPVTDGFHYVTTDSNGVYQMKADARASTVCYSLPNTFRAPLDATTHLPKFYANDIDQDEVNRRDFALEPCNVATKFTFAAIGDVHIGRSDAATETSRYKDVFLADVASELYDGINSGKYTEDVYAFTLGDLTNDNYTAQWDAYYKSVLNLKMPDGTHIPFYQTMGNHDRRNTTDWYDGKANFNRRFGPTNYSINIGKAHIIVFDDAHMGSPYTFPEEEYNWLLEDLSYVQDKSDKIVLFFCHVPFRDGKTHDGSASVTSHHDDVLNQLKQFNQAHMFTGHTHRVQEWIDDGFTTSGGYPVYEHIHAMCGGHYWYRRISPDGSPFAYHLYSVDGKEIVDMQFKGIDYTTDYQIRVYDGNQTIVNPQGNNFYWYRTDNLVSAANNYYAIGDPILQGAFVATIWKSDVQNWKFEYWQNGVKVGDLQRVPSNICDVFTASWFWGGNGGNYDCIRKDTQHYFYYKPASGNPSSEKNWVIKAIHTVPSSKNTVHTYECSTITSTYDGFIW